ncbi:element excision factor XisH family protein [Okeania sp. SIO2B3]|uniref:element excision factor XisH family protein n=1 Tax=Okeania sp. SIO2B3 TaxID=2607784 RepID=UPI0025E9FE49|nr:element excision factor XisH family protein [Okeania sp. SIO2B3]
MPAKDFYHDIVKNALIKDGWTITEKLWFKASPFKGIIKKNFHLFVNPLLFKER